MLYKLIQNKQLKQHIKLMPQPVSNSLVKLKKIIQKLSESCIKVTNIDSYLHGYFKTKEQHAQLQEHLGTKFHLSVWQHLALIEQSLWVQLLFHAGHQRQFGRAAHFGHPLGFQLPSAMLGGHCAAHSKHPRPLQTVAAASRLNTTMFKQVANNTAVT